VRERGAQHLGRSPSSGSIQDRAHAHGLFQGGAPAGNAARQIFAVRGTTEAAIGARGRFPLRPSRACDQEAKISFRRLEGRRGPAPFENNCWYGDKVQAKLTTIHHPGGSTIRATAMSIACRIDWVLP